MFTGKKVIALCGFMFSGKTKIAEIIAEKSGMAFYDTDELIQKETGLKIFDIFNESGEEEFRELEHKTLTELLPALKHAVVALGGGAVTRKETLEFLKTSVFLVYLKVSFIEIMSRIAAAPETEIKSRPLAAERNFEKLKKIYDSRLAFYESAHLSITCDELTPEAAAAKIMAALDLKK